MTQQNTIGKTGTNIRTEGLLTSVRYHNTDVVRFSPRWIVLNTGGWRTATTKTRMNQTSRQFNLEFKVFQKKGEWYVQSYSKFRWEGELFIIDRKTGMTYQSPYTTREGLTAGHSIEITADEIILTNQIDTERVERYPLS